MDVKAFTKKFGEHLRGPFALIEWKPIANKLCVGGDIMKRIVIYDEKGRKIKVYPYHPAYIDVVESDWQIPVVDMTVGQPIPERCLKEPSVVSPLGVLWGD